MISLTMQIKISQSRNKSKILIQKEIELVTYKQLIHFIFPNKHTIKIQIEYEQQYKVVKKTTEN